MRIVSVVVHPLSFLSRSWLKLKIFYKPTWVNIVVPIGVFLFYRLDALQDYCYAYNAPNKNLNIYTDTFSNYFQNYY